MKKKPFTLLELLTAMTVFTIFMLAVMRFFGLSQDVMSSSTNNVGQYEKVRVAMDMIAADLQNIYYNEGVGTIVYYQQEDSAKNFISLDIPVQRSQKIKNSDVALARVRYELVDDVEDVIMKDDSGTETKVSLKKLQMVAVGNKEDGWSLHRYDDEDPKKVFPEFSSEPAKGTILDGIVDMQIELRNFHNGDALVDCDDYYKKSTDSNKVNPRIPDYVKIKIKMVDDNVLKTIRGKKEMQIDAKFDEEKDCRLFYRRIDIDRGQSF